MTIEENHRIQWRELRPRVFSLPLTIPILWRYRTVLRCLIVREFQIRYRPLSAGILWVGLQPIFFALVIAIPLSRISNLGIDGMSYLSFVLTALVPWIFFANCTQSSAVSLIEAEELIKHASFPRALIPIAMVGSKIVDLVFALIFLWVWIWFKHENVISLATWLLPLVLLWLIFLSMGVSLFASAACAQFRDLRYVVPFIVQVLFFASPVVYSTGSLHGTAAQLILLNPATPIIEATRAAFLGTPLPPNMIVLRSLALTLVLFLVASVYFGRMSRRIADIL